MSVRVDNFHVPSFILKDAEAVEYIQRFCSLLRDSSNLHTGYLSDTSYCALQSLKADFSFCLRTGGYIDAGPELRHYAVHGFDFNNYASVEEQDNKNDPLDLFFEIQRLSQENTWFFIDGVSWDEGGDNNETYTYVDFYHQDGRTRSISNFEIKRNFLKELKI